MNEFQKSVQKYSNRFVIILVGSIEKPRKIREISRMFGYKGDVSLYRKDSQLVNEMIQEGFLKREANKGNNKQVYATLDKIYPEWKGFGKFLSREWVRKSFFKEENIKNLFYWESEYMRNNIIHIFNYIRSILFSYWLIWKAELPPFSTYQDDEGVIIDFFLNIFYPVDLNFESYWNGIRMELKKHKDEVINFWDNTIAQIKAEE